MAAETKVRDDDFMAAYRAWIKARESGFDIELQEIACKCSQYANAFARDIPGADIRYCQNVACKEPWFAYLFATSIVGADIEYCKAHMGEWLKKYLADQMIAVL